MTISYIKKADRPLNESSTDVRDRVSELLQGLEAGREAEAIRLAELFDAWTGPVEVSQSDIDASTGQLDAQTIADIDHAHANIRRFAEAQLSSLTECEIEISPGLLAGHRNVPVEVAGCYVPAGRYAHVASALMSVTTASAAGVPNIVVTSPARPDRGGVHPAILHAAKIAGATRILGLGGVQAVGALAFGLFTDLEADMIVGPGNSYVAEAKRQLFGRVGIDVVAGPTESMIAADDTADPHMVATDLIGQAEHGPTSPVWLVTTSRELAEKVNEIAARLANELPDEAAAAAGAAWRDYGEIIVTGSREESAEICDRYAPEHLQILATDLPWWRSRLRNYGSLFLGPNTNVTFGDKSSGPNHILPTGRAARYSGGLNALKFVKQLTWQELTPDAGAAESGVAGRISRLEGMEGHARSADLRGSSITGRP